MTSPLQIGTQPLTQADVVAVVRHARPVVLGPDALAAMAASRAVVDTLAARPVVDGAGQQVSTTAARGEQRRVLVLAATDAGYRISAIEPG